MAITFIGSTSGTAINGGNVTLTLSGISGIATGDLVYIASGTFGRAGNEGRIGNALGFTADRDVTNTIRLRTAYKIYNSGTDGTCTVEGSTNAADGMTAVAFVFRGTNAGTFALDVTSTTATGSSTNPDPPSITPTDANCCIIAGAVSAVVDATPGTITNYTEPTTFVNTASDTNNSTTAMAYRILSGGAGAAENPAAFSSWSTAAWVSFSVALRPSVAQTAAATFAGAGALSGSAANIMRVAATWAGAGAWSTSVTIPVIPDDGRALVSWARIRYTQAPPVSNIVNVAANFAGAGNWSTSASLHLRTVASFVGAGAWTARANLGIPASATFSGAGSFAASAKLIEAINASFNGAGSLVADAAVLKQLAASWAGAGALSASAQLHVRVSAAFAGAGSWSASMQLAMTLQGNWAGAGSWSASAANLKQLTASFAGSGGFAPFLNLIMQVQATFAGEGAWTGNVIIPGVFVTHFVAANFDGAGSLSSPIQLIMTASSNFSGAGALSADLANLKQLSAAFAGAGAWSASLTQQMLVASSWAGAGNWVASPQVLKQLSASWAGAGAWSASVQLPKSVAASWAGAGNFSAALGLGLPVAASFAGAGSFSSSLKLNIAMRASWNGAGALIGDVTVIVAPVTRFVAGSFVGAGALTATLSLVRASYVPTRGYESQVGVWHANTSRGRTGKRYRIYPPPES